MAGAAFCGNRQLYRMCGGVDWSYSPFCSAATIKPLPFTPDLRRHCWHHAWALQWAAHCRTTQCPRTGAAFTMVSHSRCATPPVRPAQSPVYVLQGSFGCVYKGTWHGKVVAIKIVNYSAAYLLQASGAAAEGAQQAGAGAAARGGGGGGVVLVTPILSWLSWRQLWRATCSTPTSSRWVLSRSRPAWSQCSRLPRTAGCSRSLQPDYRAIGDGPLHQRSAPGGGLSLLVSHPAAHHPVPYGMVCLAVRSRPPDVNTWDLPTNVHLHVVVAVAGVHMDAGAPDRSQ